MGKSSREEGERKSGEKRKMDRRGREDGIGRGVEKEERRKSD